MKADDYEAIEAPLFCLIGDGDGGTEAAVYRVGEYLVFVPEDGGPVTYRKPSGEANAQLLAAAKEALDYLTDHGIDLDGEEEEQVAGIRLRLDEAINAANGS